MTRTERTLAADRAFNAQIDATMAELRAVAMPDMSIFERGEYLAARDHLASLSLERRAELENDA